MSPKVKEWLKVVLPRIGMVILSLLLCFGVGVKLADFGMATHKSIDHHLKSYGDTTAVANATLPNPIKDQDSQLKTLYDYTVFHIGIYITLTTAILAAMSYKASSYFDLFFSIPICLFACAGTCGGIVGSNIPNYVTYSAKQVVVEQTASGATKVSVVPFLEGKYKVLDYDLTYAEWIRLEHRCFWLGAFTLIVVVLLHFVLARLRWINPSPNVTVKVDNLHIHGT